ncbi:unnamed protein product [Bemisia tabaci]|uniref:DUF4817 domain-containing protein n=1 Tax=Bemisia tabaci TaxID=7038 RepID=A0A9P0EZH8_BEMTA|nr:unnamed protein product [Bemisia tabaci]
MPSDYVYGVEDYVHMLLFYGETKKNATKAVLLWKERFPGKKVPNARTIQGVYNRAMKTGAVVPKNICVGQKMWIASNGGKW